jgi:hypothetical protein
MVNDMKPYTSRYTPVSAPGRAYATVIVWFLEGSSLVWLKRTAPGTVVAFAARPADSSTVVVVPPSTDTVPAAPLELCALRK